MRRLAAGLLALPLLASCAAPTPAPVAAWVEMAAQDTAEARIVTTARSCPMIDIDGRRTPMAPRAAPDQAFPVLTCALPIPRTAQSVKLNGKDLPVPKSRVDRIVIFGDTGCRLKGQDIQLCNDAKAWPFASVAKRAAAMHPDLVIHVGDYHYRESPCPTGVAGCAGSRSGDNWDVWNADFFAPASPLLAAAPWVVTRGNHELCGRGGKGWFRFLDAAPTMLDCPDITDAYTVRFDGLALLVFDSVAMDDNIVDPATAGRYAEIFSAAASAIAEPFWLVTHKPVWAVAPVQGKNIPINAVAQAAIDPHIPPNLDMVVSGHVHAFATFAFGPSRPAQLVAGIGGSLYDKLAVPASGLEIDGMKTAKSFALTEYGYLVMDRSEQGWTGTLRAADDDRVLARCVFAGRDIACR